MQQQVYQPSFFEYTKIVSIVYAVILVSFGIIFPIAEALKDQWLKTIYNTVFLVSNLTLSNIFLAYLLVYLLRTGKRRSVVNNERSRRYRIRYLLANIKSWICNENENGSGSSSPLDSRKNKQLITNAPNNSFNGHPLDAIPTQNSRAFSFSSTNSSVVGIDLGTFRNGSVTPDDIPCDQSYVSTRKTTKTSTIIEDDLETNSFAEDKRQQLFDESNDVTVDIDKPNEDDVTYIDVESFGSIFTHHGSSMFLRLGSLVFGLGNLIYYALEIQANMLYNVKCSNSFKFGWIFIWKFIFVLLQTFFLFKHAMIHVTKHKPFVWFGMVHLIFTNVTLWIHALVREIAEEYHYETLSDAYRSNFTEFTEALHSKCDSDLLHSATKYLMPFVLEYSLIAVGSISCFLYFGGIDRESDLFKGHRHLVRVFSLAPSDFDKYNHASQSPLLKPRKTESKVHFSVDMPNGKGEVNNNGPEINSKRPGVGNNRPEVIHCNHSHDNLNKNPLRKSHMGLFGGVVVLCLTSVACVVFLFSNLQGHPSRGEVVFYSTDITIHSLLLIACIAVFVLTRSLAFAPKPISTDDILLLIAAFGSLTYEAVNVGALFSSIEAPDDKGALLFSMGASDNHGHQKRSSPNLAIPPSSSTPDFLNFTKNSHEHDDFYEIISNLQLASAMIGLVQTAVQTLLILVSLRRYPASLKDAKEMPGRGTLAFLIVGNLSIWILRTVLCKNIHMAIQATFYGKISWHLLMNINLPLLLFFRFHSSACFADIWKAAYELFTRPEKTLAHG